MNPLAVHGRYDPVRSYVAIPAEDRDKIALSLMLHHLTSALVAFCKNEVAASQTSTVKAAKVVVPHGEESAEGATLFLRVSSISENAERRDGSFKVGTYDSNGVAKKIGPPVWLDVLFRIEAVAEDVSTEQELLAAILAGCFRDRRIKEEHLPAAIMAEHLGEPSLTVVPGSTTPFGTSFSLLATFGFNPNVPREVKMVREAVLSFGRLHDVPGEGDSQAVSVASLSAAGTVLDPEGKAVVAAKVESSVAKRTVYTDEKGIFLFLDLPAGRHSLDVSAPGFESAKVDIVVPARGPGKGMEIEPKVVSLSRSHAMDLVSGEVIHERRRTIVQRISGRLSFTDGKPAAHRRVRCGDAVTTTDGYGEYVLLLDPGTKADLFVESKDGGEVLLERFVETSPK